MNRISGTWSVESEFAQQEISMSFYLVREKYDYVPSQLEIDAARDLLREILGQIEIDYWESEEAQVVGLLTNGTQKISCTICGHVESFENPAAFEEMLFVQSAETMNLKCRAVQALLISRKSI